MPGLGNWDGAWVKNKTCTKDEQRTLTVAMSIYPKGDMYWMMMSHESSQLVLEYL